MFYLPMSTPYFKAVKAHIKATADSGKLTNAEFAVVHAIWAIRNGGRVTQKEIAKSAPWIGAHPNYDKLTGETTLRMVRQIIRNLRVIHHLGIVSDRDGYFIPQNEAQADTYLVSLEQEVRARAASSLETYRSMRTSLARRSAFFEALEAIPSSEPSEASPS